MLPIISTLGIHRDVRNIFMLHPCKSSCKLLARYRVFSKRSRSCVSYSLNTTNIMYVKLVQCQLNLC